MSNTNGRSLGITILLIALMTFGIVAMNTSQVRAESYKLDAYSTGKRDCPILMGKSLSEYIESFRVSDNEFVLPHSLFIYEQLSGGRMKFAGWAIGNPDGEVKQPGEKITLTEDTKIYDVWQEDLETDPWGVVHLKVNWEDGDDADGLRPECLVFCLYTNASIGRDSNEDTVFGKDFCGLSIGLGPYWEDGFPRRLNPYNRLGERITEAGYQLDSWKLGGKWNRVFSELDYTITTTDTQVYTFSRTPEKTTVSGSLSFDDNDNIKGLRPATVELGLYNGEALIKTITLNEAGEYSFGEVNKNAKGEPIPYEVKPIGVEGYKAITNGADIVLKINDPKILTQPVLKATMLSNSKVKLSWKPVEGATNYVVEYKRSTSKTWSKINTTKLSRTISNLGQGVKYNFRVTAHSDNDEYKPVSTPSSTKSVTTLGQVKSFKAKRSGSKYVLSWGSVSTATSYEKQVCKNNSKKWYKLVRGTKLSKTKFKTINYVKGWKYKYRVRACKTVGGVKIYGPWSIVRAIRTR